MHADVQSFILLHLVAKIGFMANDSVTSLKLLEKGLLKEDMAVTVLIDFPFQIIGGWWVVHWMRCSSASAPIDPLLTLSPGLLPTGRPALVL